jgi:hypothetical protein
MAHVDHHPTPVAGCFGCKVRGLSYQGVMSRASDRVAARAGHRPDPVHHRPVTADDGPRRGRVVGKHTEHWDGRQDATALAPHVRTTARTQEDA